MFYLRLSRLNNYDRVKNIPVSFSNKGDVNIEFNFEYGYLSNLIVFGIGHNYTWCFGIYRSYFAGIIVFFYVYIDSYYSFN